MALESVTGFISYAGGAATDIASQLLGVNPMFLLAVLVVVVIVVFYILKTIMKIAIVGLFSALLVIAANILGLPVPVSLQTLMAAATFGIIFYTILKYLEIGFKIIRAGLSPFRRGRSKGSGR